MYVIKDQDSKKHFGGWGPHWESDIQYSKVFDSKVEAERDLQYLSPASEIIPVEIKEK